MSAEPTDEARTLLKVIGRRVRLARLTTELTQTELAAAAGMSRSFLSLVEHGAHGVDIVRLQRLATALELPLVDLIDDRNADER